MKKKWKEQNCTTIPSIRDFSFKLTLTFLTLQARKGNMNIY